MEGNAIEDGYHKITISKLDTWSALSGLKVHKCGVIIPDSADVRLVDASSIALPSKYEFDALISVLDPRWIKNRSTSVDNVARGIAEGLIEPWCPFLNRVLSKTWWITKSKPCVAFEATVRDLGTAFGVEEVN